MNDLLKSIVIALVAGAVAGAIVLHFAPKIQAVTQVQQFSSPAGTTFNTAKTAAIVWAQSSNTASSTSLFNADASDRIIKQIEWTCVNMNFTAQNNLASVIFQAATTSISSQGIGSSINLALYNTVATSASEVYQATSTQGIISRRWNAGSYLTFTTNATSTSASCVIGVDYLGT